MKVFVAGATGALGTQLVPLLVSAGHDVVGTTRTPGRRERLERAGARAVVLDALDGAAVAEAVAAAEPDVIVHQLTAIPPVLDMRHFDREFAATNRLRRQGTDHLVAAAEATGVKRVVAQSNGAVPYARTGGPVKTEADPFEPDPPESMRATLDAIRHLEAVVTSAQHVDGVVLRYGWFYGPGTSIALEPPGSLVELLRTRRLPILGGGGGVWSFVHVADAAGATLAAVEGGAVGTYNVVDDEPARVADFLPALASAVGAKPPRRVPAWIGRLLAGSVALEVMTELRGASNAKAKEELGWQLRYPSWRQGFVEGLR